MKLRKSTFGLWLNSDSSICTITPGPPSITGPSLIRRVEQTSLSHWYTSTAVLLDTFVHSAVSSTGFWRAQKCSSINQVWRVSFDFAKKLLALTACLVLHKGHHHSAPSTTSVLMQLCIATLHLVQAYFEHKYE